MMLSVLVTIPQQLIIRVWNKFTRLPLIGEFTLKGLDKLNGIVFLLQEKIKKEKKRDELTYFQSLEDYFQFSNEIFGVHQIKSEIISFLEFANLEQPQHVCEIGTACGGTNFLLSQSLTSIKLMIGVDLYVKNKSQLQYFSKDSQQVIFINGSSYADRTVDKVRSILADKKLDVLFIDGDHNFDGVKQDFLKYKHLVRDGGLIVFHDIVSDYLTRYGRQTGRWAGGVPQFWSKIKLLYPHYEFVEDLDQDGLGIGVIRYSENISIPENL